MLQPDPLRKVSRSPALRFSALAAVDGVSGWFALLVLIPVLSLAGCSRFHQEKHSYVYVSARQVYLHDRVAAVSNRVGHVTNGEALEVLEQGKRFVKVRTPKGEIGWLEDHSVIDDKLFQQFQELTKSHAGDPVVATATLRDDLYLHVLPGRETPHFLLVPGNARVLLLQRGTVPKSVPGAMPAPVAKPKPPVASPGAKPEASAKPETLPSPSGGDAANPLPPPPPIPMEDWWLVRDSAGHTGWLLSGRMDVEIPDEVGIYAEGQRIVAAYPIAKVMDSGVEHERKADRKKGVQSEAAQKDITAGDVSAAATPTEHTEYVTVLSPPRSGLPYDFDQVRVFTWSLNHHRYETAYRLHGVQGYLPVRLSSETVNGQSFPTFSFAVAEGPDVSIDPDSGTTRPVHTRTLAFRMEGNLIRRTGADQAPIILTHQPDEAAKAKAAGKRKKR